MSTCGASDVSGTVAAGVLGHEVDDASVMSVIDVFGLADAAIGDCDSP